MTCWIVLEEWTASPGVCECQLPFKSLNAMSLWIALVRRFLMCVLKYPMQTKVALESLTEILARIVRQAIFLDVGLRLAWTWMVNVRGVFGCPVMQCSWS